MLFKPIEFQESFMISLFEKTGSVGFFVHLGNLKKFTSETDYENNQFQRDQNLILLLLDNVTCLSSSK